VDFTRVPTSAHRRRRQSAHSGLFESVSNAEQAIREVRESGRIQIRLSQSGENVVATVQDDGVGSPRSDAQTFFDPFYTTKRPGGGTGLGLSICLSLIREHGGTIQADSLPGGGSASASICPSQ